MGLFNNYMKEGPGVRKDAARKKGIARWWEMFTRHYGDLMKLNLWLLMWCAPLILVLGFTVLSFNIGYIIGEQGQLYTGMVLLCTLAAALAAIPVGPALTAVHAALTRIIRDEPSFLWHKFKEDFRANFKHTTGLGIVNVVLAVYQCIALLYYTLSANSNVIMAAVVILSMLVLNGVTQLLYLQIVYLDLPFPSVLKNAILIFFGRARRMLPSAFIQVIFIFGLFMLFMFMPIVGWAIVLLVCISTLMLIVDMWAWPVVDELFKISETLQQRADEQMKADGVSSLVRDVDNENGTHV